MKKLAEKKAKDFQKVSLPKKTLKEVKGGSEIIIVQDTVEV